MRISIQLLNRNRAREMINYYLHEYLLSKMKFVIIGSGAQGAGGASILGHDKETESVIVGDINLDRAQKVVAKIGSDKLIPTKMDASNLARARVLTHPARTYQNFHQGLFLAGLSSTGSSLSSSSRDTSSICSSVPSSIFFNKSSILSGFSKKLTYRYP